MKNKKITIYYYARLSEITNCRKEIINTLFLTPKEIYNDLLHKYIFPFNINEINIAINNKISTWDSILNDGDEIIFIPPVSGG